MQVENKRTDNFELIPLAAIAASPTNPRQDFPPEGIASLADSIRQHGVLQPILVRPTVAHSTNDAAAYEIVAGERRFRAAQLAEQPSIPARIVEMSDEEALQAQIIELSTASFNVGI